MDERAKGRLDIAVADRRRLLAIARHHADTAEDAKDAVSTATLLVIDAPVHHPAQVKAWLATTTIHCCSQLRRRGRVTPRAAVRLTVDAVEPDPAELICATAELHWLARRIRALPDHLRRTAEILGEGGTYRDVAADQRITPRKAREYVTDAKKRLRDIVASSRAGIAAITRHVSSFVRRGAADAALPVWDLLVAALAGVVAGSLTVSTDPAPRGEHRPVAFVQPVPADPLDMVHDTRRTRASYLVTVRLLSRLSLQQRTKNPGMPVLETPAGDHVAMTGLWTPAMAEYRPSDEFPRDTRERAPLHEWVIWCALNGEVSAQHLGCPREGGPASVDSQRPHPFRPDH